MCILHSSEQMQFKNIITYPEISFEENKFSFIAGESGCGKSTYLKILNRTVLPTSGNIFYKEKDISRLPVLNYRKEVLLVPQEVFLLDGTIEQNFEFYYDAREQQKPSESEMAKFLEICCAEFPITADCRKLSGGERQRVFLAIFLSFMPKVLLLDEPTAALDEKTSVTLLGNMKEFCGQEHITVICVCHNEGLIQQFADTIIRLGAKA